MIRTSFRGIGPGYLGPVSQAGGRNWNYLAVTNAGMISERSQGAEDGWGYVRNLLVLQAVALGRRGMLCVCALGGYGETGDVMGQCGEVMGWV